MTRSSRPGRSGVAFGLLQVGTKLSGFAASLAFGGLQLVTNNPQSGLVALIAQLTIGWWLIPFMPTSPASLHENFPVSIRNRFRRFHSLSLAVVAIGLVSGSAPVAAQVWFNANTSQFTSLALNTPTAVNFLGIGDLTMTRTSTIGSPIVTATWNGTFTTPVGGQPNPDWVLGTRSYFQLGSGTAGTLQSTVSYELQFVTLLPTTSQLVFIDFDSLEQVTIKAYDASNNLISFANTSILRSPGQDATPVYAGVSWASSVGATGLLANTDNDSESNIITSISFSTSIQRIVYDFSFSQVDSGGGTIRFQVAAVPEPATYGMGLAGMACGGVSMWRWRKRA